MAAGSKSALGKILAAIALVLVIMNPALLPGIEVAFVSAKGITGLTGTFMGMSIATTKLVLGALAVNLAMSGIMQMMAPDPSVDTDQPNNYLFNGPVKNTVQGDPVPVLYGKLRVPGQPVNFEITGVNSRQITTDFNENGATGNTDSIAGPFMEQS
jgi:predicted phage tail protein